MAVYVIVLVVLVVALVAAYRSLGGSSPRAIDTETLLRGVRAELEGSLAALTGWLRSQPTPPSSDGAVRAGRRLTAGVQATLDRVPTAQLDDTGAAACALLAAAAEDAAWAWRIVQADGDSPGLTAAVAALRDHAAACCAEAAGLHQVVASGEPLESA